jgi:hypothetical protein
MNNVKVKSGAQIKEDAPHINALSNQSRYRIEEETHAKLLEEIRKDIDNILNNIEDVNLRNEILRHKNSELRSKNEELIIDKSTEYVVRLSAKMDNNNSSDNRAEQVRRSRQTSRQNSWQSRQEIENKLLT